MPSGRRRPGDTAGADATGLELTAHELRDHNAESILGTDFGRGRAVLLAAPEHVTDVSLELHRKGYTFLASLHGVDYYPEEPRLGVLYEMLDMHEVDRITVKVRVSIDDPRLPTATELFRERVPRARGLRHVRRRVRGSPGPAPHPHAEDFEGFPQRRDFPVGGEPVLFTFNEETSYGKYQ